MRNTGTLIYGEGNLLDYALNMAAEILGTTKDLLSANPDYLFIDYDEGKSSIGVDTANIIVDKSALVATFGEHQVCVINHMDSMTEAAQNKLLKTLEESSMIIIGICYEDGILPTVKSRMRKVQLSEKVELPADVLEIFSKVSDALSSKPSDVFGCLNLVKEKDPDSFYQAHREHVGSLLTFIGNNCSSKLSTETILRLGTMREYCMSSAFTKDDFFVLIATVVNDLIKGGNNVSV